MGILDTQQSEREIDRNQIKKRFALSKQNNNKIFSIPFPACCDLYRQIK